MDNNDYILGYRINERLSYGTLYHLFWDKIPFLLNTFYIIQGIKCLYNYYPSGILYQRNVILSFQEIISYGKDIIFTQWIKFLKYSIPEG